MCRQVPTKTGVDAEPHSHLGTPLSGVHLNLAHVLPHMSGLLVCVWGGGMDKDPVASMSKFPVLIHER